MQPPDDQLASPPETEARTEALLRQHEEAIHRRTDRLFANLMIVQWLGGIVAALWISPRTWAGAESRVHIHIWAAILLGGAITSLPVFLARTQPGRTLTRQVIATGQMLTSALLIHLTGGRIETHFHVFGSLAFLTMYRDWRVLLTATVVTTADHFARGAIWPQSVFGVLAASPWRSVEHAGWVIFGDTFFVISIRQSLAEMREIALRRATLEHLNAHIERKVVERTAELKATQTELLNASRRAGMAEVATAVLHNVGNVLNSVNMAAACVAEGLRKSKAGSLTRLVTLLREHEADLGAFFTHDPRAAKLPDFLAHVAESLNGQQTAALGELRHLQKNIEHIKVIVATQQNHATGAAVRETVRITDLVEDTLRMNAETFGHHGLRVEREFSEVPPIAVEKHKVLQILVNLVRNAKHACAAAPHADRTVTLRVTNGDGRVKVAVADNGIGIPPENLTRIFNHGFTTKKDGHGFGLHSSALAAREMGGALRVESDGPGRGATFTLELPLSAPLTLHEYLACA